ncbi:AP2/B3-like transcriptional factor family protein [Striga asiatica]|uniref:AP2/B3-like transcriptional factor family protein n=1 Tax=Striga asiatica TaxID=4170 RepID=A0A5A7PM70_STRAF|nr:AP2/B3-like transcriptional factor family protein [Striga asiatica]
MRGQDVRVDNDVMKRVFGFNFVGKRSKPVDFNAKLRWKELSPHTTWDSRGIPNGLIEDLATAFVHRFIAYNITGKKEANKVSETELYLLWAMRSGVKVCSMTFLQNSLQEVALGKRGIPALGHVVTALAKYFDIPDQPVFIDATWSYEGEPMRNINEHELRTADLIRNRTTPREYTKRKAYDSYFKKLQEGAEPTTDEAGPSRLVDDNEHEPMPMDEDLTKSSN